MAWTLTAPSDNTTVALPLEWSSVKWKTERDEGRHRVQGRTHDVLTFGTMHGAEIVVDLVFTDEAEWFQISRLLQRTEVMRLETPMGTEHWVIPTGLQQSSIEPTGDQATRPLRKMSVTLIEQAAP